MFHRASHPRSIQASRPYFAFSPCIGLAYHLTSYIPLKRPKLGGLSSSYISRFTHFTFAYLHNLQLFTYGLLHRTKVVRLSLTRLTIGDMFTTHLISIILMILNTQISSSPFRTRPGLRGTLGYSLFIEIHPQLLASLLWGRLL